MSRISAVINSGRRTTNVLLYLAFIALYACSLLLESWLRDPATGVTYVLFSAGLIVGVLQISRVTHWPVLIAGAVVVRLAWLAATQWPLTIAAAALEAGVLIALAVVCGSTREWLFRRDRRELRANEMFAGGIATALLASLVFGYAATLLAPADVIVAGQMFATVLSFQLGIACVAPLIVVLVLAYGRPESYGILRILTIALTLVVFLVAGSVALLDFPERVRELLTPYGSLWTWIAIFSGLMLALGASAITSGLALLVLTFVVAVGFHLYRVPDDANPAATMAAMVEWQSAAIAIIVIVLALTALVAGRRKEKELDSVQATIASDILSADAADNDYSAPARVDALTEALGLAARYCGADECRLYSLDQSREFLEIAHVWPARARGDTPADKPERIDMRNVPQFCDDVLGGQSRTLTLSATGKTDAALAANLGLNAPVTILCHPVLSAGVAVGMIMMIKTGMSPIARRDAEPLINTIGEFYASIRLRESTRRSIRDYEQRLRDLAARFAQAEERVRRRTSVELHDGLIQRLAVARMKLGELRQRPDVAADAVSKITTIVDEALGESRAIIHNLSPSVLYELGLIPGLQTLCEELNASGAFDIVMREHGERCELQESLRVCIYHVVSELISNSIRHSGGGQVWVDLFWEQFSLDAVVVSDDGKHADWWLDAAKQRGNGTLGLLSASERLRPFGFNIKFEQRRGGGTRAIVYWNATTSATW